MDQGEPDAAHIEAGQAWCLIPASGEHDRPDKDQGTLILVGAIVEFAEHGPVVCCAARMPADGETIPFIPLSLDAFRLTVSRRAGDAELPDAFFDAFEAWMADETGKRVFDVPFEGSLDRMIARQMARIANVEI